MNTSYQTRETEWACMLTQVIVAGGFNKDYISCPNPRLFVCLLLLIFFNFSFFYLSILLILRCVYLFLVIICACHVDFSLGKK